MATIAELRQEAKKAGVPVAELRGLTQPDEIQAVIDAHTGATRRPVRAAGKKKRGTARKSTTARKKVSAARSTGSRKASARKSAPARSAKSGTAKRQATAKKTTAKRSTARKSTTTARRNSTANGNGGRNLLGSVDYSVTDGWNPREGSAPDLILKALKRARGNREKAFDYLLDNYDLKDFVSPTDSRGRRRKKAEMEWQLRYRISRTAWDFAKRTGQHEPSTNRATYGEGGTGIGVSGGMPVAFRPDDYDGKPVFKRAEDRKRATSRKATGASQTARKRTTAKKTAAAASGAKKRSQARSAGRKAAQRKVGARGRK